MHKYENLVFEGGGVLGSVYAGCLQVLSEKKLFKNIKRVAGTSAGAITAGLLAVGSGSEGLTESIFKSDFDKFIQDKGWIFGDIYRLFCRYGIHTGNAFDEILKTYIKKYTHRPNLTFSQLEALVHEEPHKYKHLSVIASNITSGQAEIFNFQNTPDLPIWKAIRCSMRFL